MPPDARVRSLVALGAGLLAALGVLAARSTEIGLEPGGAGWRRLLRGATAEGAVGREALALLPGIDRGAPSHVLVSIEGNPGGGVGVSVDGGPLRWVRTSERSPLLVALPGSPYPGARVVLRRAEGDAILRIERLEVRPARRLPLARTVLAFVASSAVVLLGRWRWRATAAAGLLAAALLALANCPGLVLVALPARGALEALLLPFVCAAAGLALGLAGRGDHRSQFRRAAWILVAAVFGAWIRFVFLPSAGSWDTEYWKAWMLRAAGHGWTQVYGGPDAVPPGHFKAQLLRREAPFMATFQGRGFFIDYPPLAMALWRVSWALVEPLAAHMDPGEAQNVAVKLPSLLGDVAAVGLLLFTLRDAGRRAVTLAVLYWALPVSWLNSAVLGYMDGCYAPVLVAALVAAGRGWPVTTGVFMALACAIKPTAVVVLPAAAVALHAGGVRIGRAVAAGLAVAVAILLPFLVAGTLPALIVHVGQLRFQERLSGGFANPWWIVSHVALVLRGEAAMRGPVAFARIDAVAFPAQAAAGVLVLAALVDVVRRARKAQGQGAALRAGAMLFFAYSVLAIGVHENHPHPLFLLLFATGLASRRLRIVAASTGALYVLNMILLSGLGRFYTPRYAAWETLLHRVPELRMALGFDLTLPLAAASGLLLVLLWRDRWSGPAPSA